MAKSRKGPSWFSVTNAQKGAASVSILGDIGGFGITFQDFARAVNAVGPVRRLEISINSDGGDVYTGFAIYNFLQRLEARKIVRVEGLAASMASVVTMAGDEIIMPANAVLMIHNPVGTIQGEGEQIVQFGESVKAMRMNIANAYADRTLMNVNKILKMMDAQTWIGAEDALAMGFATQIEAPQKMAAIFDLSKFGNAPESYGQTRGFKMKNRQHAQRGKAEDDFDFEDTPTRESIRAELLARNKEIGALCKIAGKPELAAQFIEDDKSPAEVTAELAELADADAKKATKNGKGAVAAKGGEVSARHAAKADGEETPEIDTGAVYARWNKRKALGLH